MTDYNLLCKTRRSDEERIYPSNGPFELDGTAPDTILAWHRKLVAAKWDQREKRRGPGRPGVMKEIEKLVVRFAGENPSWGDRRIEGARDNLGHRVARTTVANILKRNAIDPDSERGSRTSWSTFLSVHWSAIAAIGFTTVEVWGQYGAANDSAERCVPTTETRASNSATSHSALRRRLLADAHFCSQPTTTQLAHGPNSATSTSITHESSFADSRSSRG